MKNLFFLIFIQLFLFENAQSLSQNNCTFIKKVSVQTDVMYHGAHGIKINYQTNFDSLVKVINIDSILSKSVFDISFSFEKSTNKIKPAKGFEILNDEANNIKYTLSIINNNELYVKQNKSFFIPYSAFNLQEGEHVINVILDLNGKDGNYKSYHQQTIKQNILIHKKPQCTVVFNVDYIEVASVNAKGNAWDFAPFGYNTAPDVGVAFYVGDLNIWKKSVENNTVFALGPKSKNISFMISQGDEVNLKVIDVDLLFDDFIGEYFIKPTESDKGILHTIGTPNGKIISCNLNWKIE